METEGIQSYSILIIFTNGNVHSVKETEAALEEVKDEPLSIIIVGVGPGDFGDMAFIGKLQSQGSRVQFVDLKAHGENELAEECLKEVPVQLAKYFSDKGVQPNPPIATDEIVIEPFKEENEVQANVVVSESGDIQVESDTKPEQGSKIKNYARQGANMAYTKGRSMFQKQFGRVSKQMTRKMDQMVNAKVNQIFGIKNTPAKRKNNKKW